MTSEKSCGAAVFTKDNGIVNYVIVESNDGVFGFPKGHTEAGESEHETALREIFEETGLKLKIIDGFREENLYTFEKGGAVHAKLAIYFAAEFSHKTPVPQPSEIRSISLCPLEEAVSKLTFDSSKQILQKAHAFICGR